jgi:hypothetical protein
VTAEELPAREGWPRPLRWLLSGFIAAAVGFVVAAAATVVVIFQQYPAKVSAPDTVLGQPRAQDVADQLLTPDELTTQEREYISEHRLLVETYISDNKKRAAFVLAGASFMLFPADELSKAMRLLSSELEHAGELTDVPTGELGGSAACVNVKHHEVPAVFCGWADHGSLGLTVLVGAKDRDEAARWMLDIREAVVKR